MSEIDDWVRRAMSAYVKEGTDDVSFHTSYRTTLDKERQYVVLAGANGEPVALFRIEKSKPPRLKRIRTRWPSILRYPRHFKPESAQ